ncbi:hypothetical protein [Corynebacterium phocae]|uniref:hypothetical protein n=1 Tax=Corynebacterium phocae TaxID=161895 RepID=UPI000952A67A|nr:hypothetical protein [Corynebacterium phocae]KAA8728598.1 hypothetical protein F4V58_00260 [Corynebacterium phocae]
MSPNFLKNFPIPLSPKDLAAAAVAVVVAIMGIVGISVATTHEGMSSVHGSENARQLESRDDLLREKPIEWSRYEVAKGGDAVRIFFNTGSCEGIRTEVEETTFAVKIKLYEGVPPELDGKPCTDDARIGSTLVKLEKPVGLRRVVDPRKEGSSS